MRNFIFQIVKFFQGGSIYDTTLNVSKNRRDFTENQAVHSSAQLFYKPLIISSPAVLLLIAVAAKPPAR